MKIRMTMAGKIITASLEESDSARDFFAMLPLTLPLEDYAETEKIAYLPRKLTTQTAPEGIDPQVGDIAYYAPWGNLVFYYGGYRYSKGLIRLGHFDGGFEPLLMRGEYPLRVEPM